MTPIRRARPVLLAPIAALGLGLASPALAGEIRGRLLVSDRGDRPAAGVTVAAVPWESPADEARREARGGEAPKPLVSAVTGADGAFVLAVPAEGGKERLFRVRADGGPAVPVLFEDVYDAAETEDIGEHVLPRAEALAGKVVDGSGAPVPDAAVTLVPGGVAGDAALRAGERTVKTAADGTFRFADASAQGNRVVVEKSGFARAVGSALRSGAASRAIALSPGTPVSGAVLRADRRPAAGALVRLELRDDATRWVETDAEGKFTIVHAPAGRTTLVVDGGDAGFVAKPDVKLPLAAGKSLAVSLALPAGLEGRVADEKTGRPVPRARLHVKGADFARLVRVGPDGTFRLRGLPPRAYRVAVDDARYVPWTHAGVALAPGETKRLDVALTPGATLAGRIQDENGAGVAGAKGALVRAGESSLAGLMRAVRAGRETIAFRTFADGSFKASRLAPGDNQRLVVTHPEYERATLAGLSLPPGGAKSGVTVVLRRGASVVGVVKDASDQPLADVEVELGGSFNVRGGRGGMVANISMIGGPGARPRAKTGPDGRFEIRGVSAGEYALTARRTGFAAERVDPVKVTDQGADPLVLVLAPGATISGAVRRRSGEGAEGYFVAAGLPGRPAGPMGAGATTPTGADGSFVIEGLRAGQAYDLNVFGGTGLGPQKRGVSAPAENVEITVTGTGRIAGTALDARTGRALTDFAVAFEPDRGGGGGNVMRFVARAAGRAGGGVGEKRTFHSEDGTFTLEDVPAGTWTVVLTAKGYQPARVSAVAVEEGATKEGVEVRAAAGGTLKGRVTDAKTGRPVANATVTHEAAGAGGPGMRILAGGVLDGDAEITTDAEGRFEIDELSAGRVKVTARHPDYAEGSELADVKETGGTAEIRLAAGGALGGVVTSGGQPLPGVEVALATAGETGFGRMLGGAQGATTDGSGRFRFDHLGAGRYSVSASLRGKTSNLAEVVLQAGDTRDDVVLSLTAGSTIRGTVSGLPDGFRSGTTVMATGADAFFATTRTAADGAFEITGVPAGPLTLRAQAGDGLGQARSAMKQVTASDDVPVLVTEIVFEPGYTLSGRVTRAGQPLANAAVSANLQGGGGRQAASRTDESGAYRLEGLQDGTYAITANADVFSGGGSVTRRTITLNGDQTLDLVFPTARVSGVVTDAQSRQPLADATVDLGAAPAAGGGGVQRTATTDSNGFFSFVDLTPQTYTLSARKPDFQFEKRDVTAAEDGSSENLAIALTRGEGIAIRVRDGLYNVPLRGVVVRVLDAARAPVFTGSISLDTQGAGEIPSLKPGRYALFVDASGYAAVLVDGVSVPAQEVPIALTPGGNVDITVGPKALATGSGTAHATLRTAGGVPYPYTIFNADGRLAISADSSGERGFRRITNVAPGSYVLSLDGGAGTTFTVAEGGVTPVNLP